MRYAARIFYRNCSSMNLYHLMIENFLTNLCSVLTAIDYDCCKTGLFIYTPNSTAGITMSTQWIEKGITTEQCMRIQKDHYFFHTPFLKKIFSVRFILISRTLFSSVQEEITAIFSMLIRNSIN